MAWVVNKNTMEFKESVHTPDYLDGNWLVNPELPDANHKYWKLNTDKTKVLQMTHTEMVAVDNNELTIADQTSKVIQAEQIIQDKSRELAIEKGFADGLLNADGTLK